MKEKDLITNSVLKRRDNNLINDEMIHRNTNELNQKEESLTLTNVSEQNNKLNQNKMIHEDNTEITQVKDFLKPTNDIIFKRLFGKKGNERLIKDFLEGILNIEIESVALRKRNNHNSRKNR